MDETRKQLLNFNSEKTFLKTDVKKNFYNLVFILPICLGVVLLICCVFFPNAFLPILKSVAAGLLLIYYSWEIIYFDSIMPGIQPPSPLSPSKIKIMSGHTLHLNYAMAIIIGIFVILFVNWWT